MKRTLIHAACLVAVMWMAVTNCKNPSKEKSGDQTTADSADIFADNIRKTNFQTPEQEQKSFKLPPGFEITLFASEPDISKPINMEFDAQGRLWVTNTVEYPKPAAPGKGHDRITILEDTNGDGKADKFTTFTDSLNIPIGITTMYHGAIAYSIPNLYKFIDTNGDDRADQTTKLVGPFEFADTHGMVNNLIRGYDGWVHACHGYANNSTVAGTDGDSIHMNSGNTFRFREDGSRVEATTFGRINPFGYAYDEWGYLYSLDCHTKPIYQLIAGAQYPSQGTKEPAIGWAPIMMSYEFGSTANSGLVYYTGNQFPEEYRHNFYSGNVVTSKINRNTMTLHGSSPESKREEDFVTTDDPWFRPVDIKTGPDGSMYVADFYNRIIGHYEVPKDHPGRDKRSGRIWKITYTGNKKAEKYIPKDWSKASLQELIAALNYPQLNIRMIIANQVVDAFGQKAVAPVKQMMESVQVNISSFVQGLWILYRLNALDDTLLDKALHHNDAMVQVHALRVLKELKTITDDHRSVALQALNSKNAQVQRMAAEVLGHFPKAEYVQPLINVDLGADDRDTHLKYTAILSIRDHLRNASIMKQIAQGKWSENELSVLITVIPEVPSKEAAYYALSYLQTHKLSGKQLQNNLQYISRYTTSAELDKLIAVTRKNANDPDVEYRLYTSVRDGVAQRGGTVNATLKNWGISIAERFLQNINDSVARQVQATKIAADYKIQTLEPALQKLLATKTVDPKARVAAADALMTISPQRNTSILTEVFNDKNETPELRAKMAGSLSRLQSPEIFSMFGESLKSAPRALQVSISTILATSAEGIDHLLSALKSASVPTDVLEENSVKERLTANIKSSQRQELNKLTAGKLGVENRKELIAARLNSWDPGSVSIDTGRQVFLKNCSICHTIGNTGGNIGPQLNGIGTWGPNALAEKILDPNANISEAFRTYNITLTNGKTLSGLFRREEGELLVFADFGGQEFTVPKSEIKEKTPSKYTLMPDHFRNTIAKKDFDALLKYLLSIKEKS